MEISTLFKWRIDQFSRKASRDNLENKYLDSPALELSNGAQFSMEFDPVNQDEGGDNSYCSFFLNLKNLRGNKSVQLNYRLWIENNVGERLGGFNEVISHTFDESSKSYGYSEFLHNSLLYGSTATFVKDDTVFICCDVKVSRSLKRKLSSSESNLREKLYSFYEDDTAEHCILHVPKKKFKVSKAVLIAQSEVFEKMFATDTKEKQENEVIITDATPEIMEQFIRYLYLQKIEDLDAISQDLFILADKYAVEPLKKDCVESMSKTFSKKNALERLKLAFAHNDSDLKEHILAYVCDKSSEGRFRDIVKTEEWANLAVKNKQLVNEISDAIFDKTGML